MSIPKIRTTVYSHKVIDVVKFNLYDDMQTDAIYELMEQLAENISLSQSGLVHIKVDRPLSQAELYHRMGVVSKNIAKSEDRAARWGRYTLELERAEYERLKAKFEELP